MTISVSYIENKYKGVWQSLVGYQQHDLVQHLGSLYVANVDFVSGVLFDLSNWVTPDCLPPPSGFMLHLTENYQPTGAVTLNLTEPYYEI